MQKASNKPVGRVPPRGAVRARRQLAVQMLQLLRSRHGFIAQEIMVYPEAPVEHLATIADDVKYESRSAKPFPPGHQGDSGRRRAPRPAVARKPSRVKGKD